VLENAGPCDPVAMHMDWDCSCPGILKKASFGILGILTAEKA